jgi:hypothetical protein
MGRFEIGSKFLVDEGLENWRGKKRAKTEKKCQTHKNKTKQKVCVLHACFWCVLQNTLLRTFSLNFFLVLQLSSLSLYVYNI